MDDKGLMTLDEMREHEWWVSWSGGKDSTATILLMREHNIPIKGIIYVRMMYDDELPATLPVMTDFVDKTIKRFEEWGYDVKVVKSLQTADEICHWKYKRSKFPDRNGKKYGVTGFARQRCCFTDIKSRTIESIIKQLTLESPYQMIGYAIDEVHRISRLGGGRQSIMVALNIKEEETFDICKKYDMLSPLYGLGVERDGCWFCPNTTKKFIDLLKKQYPELVEKIYHMICMSEYHIASLYKWNSWVKDFMDTRGFVPKPLTEEEVKEKLKKKQEKHNKKKEQLSLFDNNDSE